MKFRSLSNRVVDIVPYLILLIFLAAMLLIHRYIFLYADDLYYSRDAGYGLAYLPKFIFNELNSNGRVWIGVSMLAVLKNNIYLFRILNPLILVLTVYLIAKISTFSSKNPSSISLYNSKNFAVALLSASLLFLLLPIEIASTTIYYAACAFNYLYPMTLVFLYAYLLYKDLLNKESTRGYYLSLMFAFFAGSSTQQAGMIAIGFAVLFYFYFRFHLKKKVFRRLIPHYILLSIGYAIITYGSLQRYGRQDVVSLSDMISGLLITNIFSIPVSGYVLILSFSSIFWLYHFTYRDNQPLFPSMLCVNKILGALLLLAIPGYIYVVLYNNYPVHLFSGGRFNTILSLSFVAFTLVFLANLLYSSTLILFKERNPFLFFSTTNAIGAQVMLIVGKENFAGVYKIMFPSLLLMSLFIVYSFIKFSHNKVFLSLSMLALALSLDPIFRTIMSHFWVDSLLQIPLALVAPFFLLSIVFILFDGKYIKGSNVALIIVLAFLVFGSNVYGYQLASTAQNYNLSAINEYHENPDKRVLILKEVPVTRFGYNVGNWNDMPLFMKQYYQINEDTLILYQDSSNT